MAKLGEIFNLQMGKTPARSNDAYWNGGQYNWISIADLGTYHKYTSKTKEQITELAVQESGIKKVPKNTVIMSFKLSLGKTAITSEEIYTNEAIMAFIPKKNYEIYPDYFYYFFSGRDWSKSTNRAVMGTTLNKATLSEIDIEIPSMDKQHLIVKKMDLLCRLIEFRKHQLEKLDELVKSRFIEMFGEGQYPKTTLINLIEDGAGLSYGIVQPGDDGTGDMGVLRPIDIVDGKISTKSIKYIDRSIGDGFKKTELAGDEILITVRGTTGITALTDSHFIGMNVTRGIAVIRYDCSKINPIYLNAYFNTEESQRYIQEHTRGATLRQINLSDLRAQEISVPPKFQQNQFADFVAQVDKSKLVAQRGAVGRFFHKRDSLHRIYLQ